MCFREGTVAQDLVENPEHQEQTVNQGRGEKLDPKVNLDLQDNKEPRDLVENLVSQDLKDKEERMVNQEHQVSSLLRFTILENV